MFVLTHHVPEDPPPGSIRYVTDVHECAAQARAAAGDGEVMVHGAGAAQALLRAGQLDELELHVVPVLLGGQRMPAADHLPYALHCLPDLNAAHIRTESADTDVTMLVERLSEPVLRPERPAPP